MFTLKKVKELVEAPSHAKRTPSPKMLFEEGIVLLRREFDQGSHLTVYNSGYVLFSAGKRNTVFHIHDCQGDYAYDAAEGKGDVIKEEYFENCEWHIRALFEGERKMEDNQAKCEGAGRSNVCVSYHALSEDWSEIADRTINMLEKIIENEAVHAMLRCLFRNPTYTGATANGSRQIIAENCHEPYITKEQFYAFPCNMREGENKISIRKSYKKPNPLAKHIVCTCGHALCWHKDKRTGEELFYCRYCRAHKENGKNLKVPAATIYKKVMDALELEHADV